MHAFLDSRAIRFLGIFFGVVAAGYALVLFAPLGFLEEWEAQTVGAWLGLPVSGNTIAVPDGVFLINAGCTGVLSILLLAAILAGLREPDWKTRALIWASGSAILFLTNLLRVALVVEAGRRVGMEIAGTLHVASWFLVSALVIGLSLFLIDQAVPVKRRHLLLG